MVFSGLFPTRALLGAFLAKLRRQWLSFLLLFVALAVATAVCVVLLGAIRYYFAPGRLVDADLWRIDTVWTSGHSSESGRWATSPDPLARLIRQDQGALATAGRFTPVRSQLVIDELSLPGGAVFRSDPPSLAVFDWKVQKGAFATGQPGPGDALISATEARRLFGERNPIGLRISLSRADRRGQTSTHTVAAVFTPFAENGVFQPDLVLVDPVPGAIDRTLLPGSLQQLPMEWLRPNAYTFVRVPGQGARERVETIAADLTARAPYLGGWVPDFQARAAGDIWLSEGAYEELVAAISPASARLMWLSAAVLACVALAAFGHGVALARLQTAALFETLGSLAVPPAAGRMALAAMTAAAAVGFCTLGVVGGVGLSRQAANFLRMDPSAFAITPREGMIVLAVSVPVFVAVGLLSLARPTISVRTRRRALPLWITFVVGSTAAGLSLVLLLQQLHLARQDTGMLLDGVLALQVDQDSVLGGRHDAFRQELLSLPDVREVGFAKTLPGALHDYSYMELRAATDRRQTEKRYQALAADAGFLRSIGVKPVAGSLPENWGTRTDQAVLNRSAAEQLGFSSPEEAIGQVLLSFDGGLSVRLHVAAVVEDFRLNGRHVPNSPLVLYHDANLFRAVTIRFDAAAGPSRLAGVVPVWWRLWPHATPSRIELAALYGTANRPAEGVAMLTLGTWITVLVVIGGTLFAVIRFQSVTCRRELGLRQLLGARPIQLAPVLANHLVTPLLCAMPFAGAATIALGQAWLSGQADRISVVSPTVLAIICLGLALSSALALASCIAVELFLVSRGSQVVTTTMGGP